MSEIDEEKRQTAEETNISDTSDESAVNSEQVAETAEQVSEEETKPYSGALDWINSIVFAASAVLVLSLFLFRSITVSGTSMCNTLQDGNMVLAENFCYTPKAGDIVVIQSNKLVNKVTGLYGEPIIKRVIGVEGDTIRFDFTKGEVYRNGELLTEDYIAEPTHLTRGEGWCQSGVDYVVPENCVFVMGDNRNVSHDSRDLDVVGFVDTNYIMGKAYVRFSPLSQFKWL